MNSMMEVGHKAGFHSSFDFLSLSRGKWEMLRLWSKKDSKYLLFASLTVKTENI